MPVYTRAKLLMATDRLGWTSAQAVFRCMLLTPSYTYSRVHATVADVQDYEVADASYQRRPVVNRTVVEDVSDDRARLHADSILFEGLDNVTVGGALIYRQFGGDDTTPTNDLLLVFLPHEPVTMTGRNTLVEFSMAGVLSISAG